MKEIEVYRDLFSIDKENFTLILDGVFYNNLESLEKAAQKAFDLIKNNIEIDGYFAIKYDVEKKSVIHKWKDGLGHETISYSNLEKLKKSQIPKFDKLFKDIAVKYIMFKDAK